MTTRLPTTDARPSDHHPYVLRREGGCWEVTFEGRQATFRHEQGALYVAWLLLHPPRKPIHALALALEARTFSSQPPGAADAVQQRYLGLDEAEAVRNLRRRERELEAVLDDDEAIEPVKAEALRKLAAIADFMRAHPWRSRDCVQKCAREVRLAIRCLRVRLAVAVDAEGKPDAVLRAFAQHLDEHLLIPSDGGGIPGRFRLGAALPGWFTYEPPQGAVWECGVRNAECGVQGPTPKVKSPESKVQSPEAKVQSAKSRVLSRESGVGSAEKQKAESRKQKWGPGRQRARDEAHEARGETRASMVNGRHPSDRRTAAVGYLAGLLCIGVAMGVLATGCVGPRPLKGGRAVIVRKPAGVFEQTLVQSENPAQATKQDQESVKVRSYTVPAGSRMEQSLNAECGVRSAEGRKAEGLNANAQASTSFAASRQPSTLNSQPSTSFVLSAPMPVVEREETRARTELGAAQKDTARELGAKLSSLKGIVWVGVGLFVFGLASLVWPPLKVIIGSVTTSAALMLGGVALMVLPSLVVGNELLILGGVAVAVGGWFLAHRHGELRGMVGVKSET